MRPTHSLRGLSVLHALLGVLLLVLGLSPRAFAASAGDYRSLNTGNWNSLATWQTYNGSSWVAATSTPTSADGVITIRNNDNVTIAAAGLTVDQVTVNGGGTLTIASGITWTLADGAGTDLTIDGVMVNAGGTWSLGANATWQVDDGGTYVHNTTAAVGTLLDRATLAAASTFIYRGSTTITPPVSLGNRTYGNLTFESTAGSWSFVANASSPVTVLGNFLLGANVTMNSQITGLVTIGGSFTNNGTLNNQAGTQAFLFTGAGATIGGTSATTFEQIRIASGAVVTVASAVTFDATAADTIDGTLGVTNATLTVNAPSVVVTGTFRLGDGGVYSGTALNYDGSSSTLEFANTAGAYAVSGKTYWPTSNSSRPRNVNVSGTGGIALDATARTVPEVFQTAGPVNNAGVLGVTGTAQLNGGGSFDAAPTFGGNGTLLYNATASVGPEWSAGTIAGVGVPQNVIVQAGTVTLPAGDRTCPGDLTITGGTFKLSGTNNADLAVGGNWLHSGGTFTNNGRTVTFNGTGTQSLTGSGAEVFTLLVVDKASGTLVLGSDVTVARTGGDALRLKNAGTLDLGAFTLKFSGGSSNLVADGGVRTISGSGGILTNSALYTTVVSANGGSLTCGAGVTVVPDSMDFGANLTTIEGTVRLDGNPVYGSVKGHAPLYASGSTLFYNYPGLVVRGLEWSATSGAGYPANVRLANSTYLQFYQTGTTSLATQCAGTLTIDDASTLSMTSPDGTAPLSVLGNVVHNGFLNFSALAGCDLKIAGNWTQGASGHLTNTSRVVWFTGTGAQTLSNTGVRPGAFQTASATQTFSVLGVDKVSGTLTLGSDVTLSAASGDVLQLVNAGDLNLGGFTLALSGAGGNIKASGGARTIGGTGTLAISGTKAVTSASGGTLVCAPGVIVAATASFNCGAGLTTIQGTLSMKALGSITTNPPVYASGSLLQYTAGGSVTRGTEWSASSGAGYPYNVQLSGNTTLDLGFGGAGTARQCAGNLTIDAGSALRLDTTDMTQPLTVLGNLTLNGTLALSDLANGGLNLSGNWTRAASGATFTPKSRAVSFQGAALQTLTGVTTFDSLTVNNAEGVSLAANSNVTVNKALTLTAGVVTAGSDTVTIGSSASVARTGGWVFGKLKKQVPTGAPSRTFEVGDAARYAPVQVDFANVTVAGNLIASTAAGDQPNLASCAFLNGAKSANRSWSLSNGGVSFSTYDATFTFNAADLDAGADPLAFRVGQYNAPTWNLPAAGNRTSTSTQATGLTGFGDFATAAMTAFTITASAGAGGSIAPSGAVQVLQDSTQTFSITPTSSYAIADVLVDGVSVGPVPSYSFTHVQAPHTIAASFASAAVDYRSSVMGNWNDPATWEVFVNSLWVPASAPPDTSSRSIALLSGANVSVSSAVTADNLTIDVGGQLTINSGQTLTLADGPGTDLTINGALTNSGSMIPSPGATWGLNDGATFTHFSTSSIVAALDAGTLSAASTFIYKGYAALVPPVSTSNRTYGNLKFSSGGSSWTANAGGTGPLTVLGDFEVASSVTYNTTQTGVMSFAGNFTINGTLTNGPAHDQTYRFTGSDKKISGLTSLITLGTVLVPNTASVTIGTNTIFDAAAADTIDGTLGIGATSPSSATLTVNAAVLQVNGELRVDRNGLYAGASPTYGPNSTLHFNTAYDDSLHPEIWPAGGSNPFNVTVSDGGSLKLRSGPATVNGVFQTAGNITHANSLVLNGITQFNPTVNYLPNSFFDAAPTYGSNSTLIYAKKTLAFAGPEWGSGTSVGVGVPKNVIVQMADNSSELYLSTPSSHTCPGDFTLTTGVVGSEVTASLNVKGKWIAAGGTLDANSNFTVVFNGSVRQSVNGPMTFPQLKLDNLAGLALGGDASITKSLTLTKGALSTGGNVLIIDSTATVARTSGYVHGTMRKRLRVSAGSTSWQFDVGDSLRYAPVKVDFPSGITVPGALSAFTTAGDHPNVGSSPLVASKTANRYWTVTNAGLTFPTYNATFTFDPSDLDLGASTANFRVAKFDEPAAWALPAAGTRTATSTQATGMTSFSDFAVGEPTTYTIAASAGPGGTITPSGTLTYLQGASQTFTIAASAQHSIADVVVDGVSVGAVSSYTFSSLTANHTIAASFAIDTFTITASAGAHGAIAPAGATVVNAGDDLAYAITPEASYHIADVLVDGASVGAVSSYTFHAVSANHTIAASFALDTFIITATAGAHGAIAPAGVTVVNSGDDLAYTIAPEASYRIADVLVDGASVGAVPSYTFHAVTANHTIAASFVLDTYTITATAGAHGAIAPAGVTVVTAGNDLTYTITPDAVSQIADVLVDGVSVGAVASYSFLAVAANHTIDATFTQTSYTITATAGANGSITPSGVTVVNHGDSLTYAMTPADHYHVADVLVDNVSVGAVSIYSFVNVTADHTIAVSFALDSYTITATAGPNGTITPSGTLVLGYGATQVFTMAGSGAYKIADVQVDGASVGAVASYTFTNVTANHTIAATFALGPFMYRSVASGNWNAPSTWQFFNGTDWVLSLANTPTSADSLVTVRSPHVVTISAPVTIDQTTVEAGAQLTVASGQTLTLANGAEATDLTLNGTILVQGTFTPNTSSSWVLSDGATYIQNTTSGQLGTVLDKGTLQPKSNFVYRGSSTLTPSLNTNGRTYGNVSFESTSGSWTAAANGSGTLTVAGDFLVGPNVTYSSSQTGVMTFSGNFTNNGTITNGSGVQKYTFSGAGKTLGGASATSVEQFNVSSGASLTVVAPLTLASSTATVTGTLGVGNATLTATVAPTVNGTFRLDQGGVVAGTAFTYGAAGTLVYADATGSYNVSAATVEWPVASPPFNVRVTGAGGVTLSSARTVAGTFETAGPILGASLLTIGGTAQFDAGGSADSAPVYGSGATLLYAGALAVGQEWSAGGATGAGVPRHVSIQAGAGTVTLPAEERWCPGTLTLTSGTLAMNGAASALNVGGDWIANGGAFAANGGLVSFNGTAPQSLTGATSFDFATLANAAGLTLADDITVNRSLTLTAGLLSTGAHAVTLGTAGDVTRTSGYIVGTQRAMLPLGLASRTFAIGDVSHYAGVQLDFADVTVAGTVSATTTAGDHPSLDSSPLLLDHTVNRYWSLTNAGAAFSTYNATFTFDPADLDAAADPAAFRVAHFDAPSTWMLAAPGARTGTSTQALGLASFSDFAVGNVAAAPTYAITATAGEHGAISPSGVTTVDAGAGQTYTMTPDAGYHIADVRVDGASVGAVAVYDFVNVNADHTIEVSFAATIATYTITATAGEHGLIAPAGVTVVNQGDALACTITPDAHYHVDNVVVDGDSIGPVTSYVFTNVAANHTIDVSFAIDTYTITASTQWPTTSRLVPIENGRIDPAGVTTVPFGGSQVYTITAGARYRIEDVIVDETSVGPVSTYEFDNVSMDHTIVAIFGSETTPVAILTAGPQVAILNRHRHDAVSYSVHFEMIGEHGTTSLNARDVALEFDGTLLASTSVTLDDQGHGLAQFDATALSALLASVGSGDAARVRLLVTADGETQRAEFSITVTGLHANASVTVLTEPVLGSTRIQYVIPEDGIANLELFDARGRLVRALVQEVASAGRYEVQWDGRDTRGVSLPAGAYYLRGRFGTATVRRGLLKMR